MKAPRYESEYEPDTSKEWERQPGETSAAHARFQEYLALGSERSLRAVAGTNGNKKQHVGGRLAELSIKNRWQERAMAYDAAEAANRLKTAAESRERVQRRFVEHAEGMLERAAKAEDRNAATLTDAAVKSFQAVFGKPVERIEQDVSVNPGIHTMTPEQRMKLYKVIQERRHREIAQRITKAIDGKANGDQMRAVTEAIRAEFA